MIREMHQAVVNQLANAERYVREGEVLINNQRARVRYLESKGRTCTESRLFLAQLEKAHAIFISDRDRLKAECAAWAGVDTTQASERD